MKVRDLKGKQFSFQVTVTKLGDHFHSTSAQQLVSSFFRSFFVIRFHHHRILTKHRQTMDSKMARSVGPSRASGKRGYWSIVYCRQMEMRSKRGM
jgi:hypothetical protein